MIFYIPSLILFIISLLNEKREWGYIGAIGWLIFVTAIIISFRLLANLTYNLQKSNPMKWTTKRTASWLEEHFSDQNERIVQVNKGTPVKIMPQGSFRVGLYRHYDELVLVDLRPKQIKLDFSENDQLTTSDNVKLGGVVSLKACVKNKNEIILKLVSNEVEEDETLKSYCRVAIKTIISQYKWIELMVMNVESLKIIKDGIKYPLTQIEGCFNIEDVVDINLNPIDKSFSETLENRQKEIENTKLKIAKLQAEEKAQEIIWEIEKKKIQKEYENTALSQQKKIELEEELYKIELRKKEDTNAFELKQKQELANLEKDIFEQRIKMLKENPEALSILDPETYKEIRIAEIEAQKEKDIRIQKSQETLIKWLLDAQNARREGMIRILEELPADNIGINLKQIIASSEESDLKKEFERLKKENEDLKEGNVDDTKE